MIDVIIKLKSDLAAVLPEQRDLADLNISDVAESYECYVREFKLAVELLGKTVEEDDKVAIQCALTRVRMASLNLSNTYQDIIDDVVLINKSELY